MLYKVDAKQMSLHYFLKTQRFDRIVYNLPHVGFLYRESSYCQIQLCYVSLIFLFYSPPSFFYLFNFSSIFYFLSFIDYMIVSISWIKIIEVVSCVTIAYIIPLILEWDKCKNSLIKT